MENIIENNKLIAEFLNITLIEGFNKETGGTFYYYNDVEMQDFVGMPEYHNSWNDLMPVVEKIESIIDELNQCRFNVQIEQCFCCIVDNKTSEDICEFDGDTKIEVVYTAVVEFIKFWNKNKDK